MTLRIVSVKLDEQTLRLISEAVSRGYYPNRSSLIRAAVRYLLTGSPFDPVEGFEYKPPTGTTKSPQQLLPPQTLEHVTDPRARSIVYHLEALLSYSPPLVHKTITPAVVGLVEALGDQLAVLGSVPDRRLRPEPGTVAAALYYLASLVSPEPVPPAGVRAVIKKRSGVTPRTAARTLEKIVEEVEYRGPWGRLRTPRPSLPPPPLSKLLDLHGIGQATAAYEAQLVERDRLRMRLVVHAAPSPGGLLEAGVETPRNPLLM